jgi:hypothetical protein
VSAKRHSTRNRSTTSLRKTNGGRTKGHVKTVGAKLTGLKAAIPRRAKSAPRPPARKATTHPTVAPPSIRQRPVASHPAPKPAKASPPRPSSPPPRTARTPAPRSAPPKPAPKKRK